MAGFIDTFEYGYSEGYIRTYLLKFLLFSMHFNMTMIALVDKFKKKGMYTEWLQYLITVIQSGIVLAIAGVFWIGPGADQTGIVSHLRDQFDEERAFCVRVCFETYSFKIRLMGILQHQRLSISKLFFEDFDTKRHWI